MRGSFEFELCGVRERREMNENENETGACKREGVRAGVLGSNSPTMKNIATILRCIAKLRPWKIWAEYFFEVCWIPY